MTVDVFPIAAPWGRFDLYSFFIDAPEPALVDTGVAASAAGVPAALERLGRRVRDLKWILLTHGHIDHVGGAYALWQATGRRAEVVIGAPDAGFVRSRRAHVDEALALRGDRVGRARLEAAKTAEAVAAISGEFEPTLTVGDGDVLDLGGVTLDVHAVPGHTAGAVAYAVDGHIFAGDAVQAYGAASGFPGYEDPDEYRASLERLRALRPEHLYLGHPYRRADGTPLPVVLSAGDIDEALAGSLASEVRIRAAVADHPPREDGTAYAPYGDVAASLGYTGDPTLEPSPFFTTMRGYAVRH